MSETKEFSLKTEKEGMYNITGKITEYINECGVENGIAYIFCPHTTAAITISENTDSRMCSDMLTGLNRAFPNYDDYTHNEGNSFAHIRSSTIGCEMFILISDGWPVLGPWQAVFFLEFDGPRERNYYIRVTKD